MTNLYCPYNTRSFYTMILMTQLNSLYILDSEQSEGCNGLTIMVFLCMKTLFRIVRLSHIGYAVENCIS